MVVWRKQIDVLRIIGLIILAYAALSWACDDAGVNGNDNRRPVRKDNIASRALPPYEVEMMNVADLVKLARINASGPVPEQSRQSLPLPTVKEGTLYLQFFFSPALAQPGQPVKLYPPHYLLRLNPVAGRLEELRAVSPQELGQPHRPTDVIGSFAMPEGMTTDQFIGKSERLYQLYDQLIPVFAGLSSEVETQVSTNAKEFWGLFELLSEQPLRPYYNVIGREFFSWLRTICQ